MCGAVVLRNRHALQSQRTDCGRVNYARIGDVLGVPATFRSVGAEELGVVAQVGDVVWHSILPLMWPEDGDVSVS